MADLTSHRADAEVENALWLMSSAGGGLPLELAARRVGLHPDTLAKRLERASTQTAC